MEVGTAIDNIEGCEETDRTDQEFLKRFRYVNGPSSPAIYCFLEDIQKENTLLYFDMPKSLKFQQGVCIKGPASSLKRQASHAEEEIRYRFTTGKSFRPGEGCVG